MCAVKQARETLFTRHKLTLVRPGVKLTRVVFTRHFSKLTHVEPGLAVFTRQRGHLHEPGLAANPGQDASLGQPFSSQTLVAVYMNLPGQTKGSCK